MFKMFDDKRLIYHNLELGEPCLSCVCPVLSRVRDAVYKETLGAEHFVPGTALLVVFCLF